jgi:mannose-P-dolichol utilization defect protein 1
MQEVDDPVILYGFIAGFLLNAVLAAQMIYYWNSPSNAGKATSAKRTEKPYAAVAAAAPPSQKSQAETTGAKTKSPSTRRRG